MPIPLLTTLPDAPQRSDTPAVFAEKADTFVGALTVLQAEINATVGQLNPFVEGVALISFDSYQGVWSAGTYALGESVYHTASGALYISDTAGNDQEPPHANWRRVGDASVIQFSNAVTGMAATTIQAAIDEFHGAALLKAGNLAGLGSQSTARGNLGLGSMATQNSNAVAITGGTVSGISLSQSSLPAGSILQVVEGTTATPTTIATETMTDVGLSATITPRSTSSKILVLAQVSQRTTRTGSSTFAWSNWRLLRASTTIAESTQAVGVQHDGMTASSTESGSTVTLVKMDSPSTAGAVTYKVQASGITGVSVLAQRADSRSTITLLEVAG